VVTDSRPSKPRVLRTFSYKLICTVFPFGKYFVSYPVYANAFNRLLLRTGLFKRRFVTKDNRVRLWRLEIHLAYGCNLDCPYCSQMSPYQKGGASADEITHMFETWNKKIAPRVIGLQGGEPLLNPELERIIYETRRLWPEARIEIVTNGLLVPKVSEASLQAARDANAHVIVSKHFDEPDYNEEFGKAIDRLETMGVFHTVRPSRHDWQKYHQVDSEGRPKPYHSDPCKAWKLCCAKNHVGLAENRLFFCCLLGNVIRAFRQGVLDEDWEVVVNYQPLTPDATVQEILDHLYSGAFEECCICPDRYQVVPASEIHGIRSKRKAT